MMKSSLKNTNFLLLIILLIAIVSRFYNITYQSYWYDEIYLMNVANPNNTFNDIIDEMRIEFHPPFQYFLTYFICKVFGYNDLVGRVLSALIGTGGIIAMFYFGKELKDRSVGNAMALITTFNYYHLYHSQEVRMYISLFLFTALSSIYLIRILKSKSNWSYILFVLFSTLNIYTHYFGLFVLVAHFGVLGYIILFKGERKYLKGSGISLLAVILLYLPWMPFIINSGGKSHWMTIPKPWYIFEYWYNMLGKEPVSFLIYILGFVMFFAKKGKVSSKAVLGKYNAYHLLFGLGAVYILTYFVSFFKPILQLRCTIAAIPFLIALVSLGIDKLNLKTRYLVYGILVISSALNLLFINKYYIRYTKENYRDITEKLIEYPMSGLYLSAFASSYNYYFNQYKSEVEVKYPEDTPVKLFKNNRSFILLNAHDDWNIMTLLEYKEYADYILENYVVDTTVYSSTSKTENYVIYSRNEEGQQQPITINEGIN